jgi:phosphate transport system substrate-binding protein
LPLLLKVRWYAIPNDNIEDTSGGRKIMSRKVTLIMSVVLLLTVLISACAQSTPFQPAATEAPQATEVVVEQPTQPPAAQEGLLPAVDPTDVKGAIITAGSSTVFPLTEAVATLFKDEGYTDQITIDSIGTGGGFERFCKTGETDIANASRPVKDSEVENCAALSPARTPIEFRVGTDALAVVVSSANDFLTDVTKEELAKIFSVDATKWSDIRPEWPAENILRYSPGTDSGTFDYFVEAVMDPAYIKDAEADKGKGEEAILKAANLTMSEDDNVLVQGVEGSPYAIGYFGYAYFAAEAANLKAISVDGIAPSAETAESGEYPLARPLFIYSDAEVLKSKPQVADFVNFYLTRVNDVILDVGYFPASEAALNAAKEAWLTAVK